MKRTALLLAALAMSGLAFADQPSGPPHGGPGRGGPPIERLTQDLGLDSTQAAQVKQILDARHAKHEQMDAELDQQLATVLTPEQLAKFK